MIIKHSREMLIFSSMNFYILQELEYSIFQLGYGYDPQSNDLANFDGKKILVSIFRLQS